MYFKRYSLLVASLLVLVSGQVYAQKAKRETTSVTYIQNPIKSLPEEIKTYSVEVNYSKDKYHKIGEHTIKDQYMQLSGFQKTDKEDADLYITYTIGTYMQEDHNLVTRKGKPISGGMPAPTYHYYMVRHKFPLKMTVTLASGEVLYDHYIDGSDNFKLERAGKEYTTRQEAEKYWNSLTRKQIDENKMRALLEKAQENLQSYFGYPEKKVSMVSISFKPSKGFTYDDMDEAQAKAVAAFTKLNTDRSEEGQQIALAMLKEARDIWKAAAKEEEVGKNTRITKKVAFNLLLNIGVASYWLEDFVTARTVLNLAAEIKMINSYTEYYLSLVDEGEERAEARAKSL
ncbi:hypothetical protein AB9P05_21370 [Roseivirga sp. BDSF3-8]|uniref:hypothetical protein n=1 Tax=Roseivirga sp. BDSF3-8 TaxID=3241598 RepID=UPI00353197AC